jgi:shikimate kinase
MTRPIFLIGFMASGKTAVGRRLAQNLVRHLIDLDHEIERRAGKRIHEIIRLEGEEAFRIMESSELRAATGRSNTVIATGGGIVMREENRKLMASSGDTIWLDLPFDECWKRIERDKIVRPLAPNRDAAIMRWNERRDLYAQCRLRIELNGTESAEAIATRIASQISKTAS